MSKIFLPDSKIAAFIFCSPLMKRDVKKRKFDIKKFGRIQPLQAKSGPRSRFGQVIVFYFWNIQIE
ncbi:hypothetical protein KHM19_29870 [Leptospira borgpetersenii]|nr:hypothetical protein KHM09_29550 [Leptospira borgpetersenii]GIM23804.1 hypothetical protein KHM19_29870 [Leptospira borgpetersenii]GIM27059.1 hypothetical protein KHM25_29840 [Leptospira borgpetersenii]